MAEHQKDIFEVTTAAHWKALSHPLRLGILSLLQKSQMTNEELAHSLGVESGKLYFHTKQLRDAGLIVPAGTRQKGPITEKLYAAAAKNYFAPPPALDGNSPPFADLVSTALSLYRNAWEHDPAHLGRLQLGYHVSVTIPRESAREIAAEFKAILERLAAEDGQDATDDSIAVATTVLMHWLPAAEPKNEGT